MDSQDLSCFGVKPPERIYHLSKGVDSLTKEEHGRFFEAKQRLELTNEIKQAAIALYLDFKTRPIGKYNREHKNLDIFLVASISLAAKALGDLRTDQEIEQKLLVSREKLVDAEDRIIRSFNVQDHVIPLPDFVMQLTQRQIQTMVESFAGREMIGDEEKEELLQRCLSYLDSAIEKGLSLRMGYRGRAAGVMLKAVRDLGLEISAVDVARASGADKTTMMVNTKVVESLLRDSPSP